MTDLSVNLAGIDFKNPVCTSSGTCNFGRELNHFYDISRLGGLFTKGTTIKPCMGNPTPRVIETPSGMINSVGMHNPGIDAVLRTELPWLVKHDLAVIANVVGFSIEEYVEVASRLDGFPGLDGLELNISCPNIEDGLAYGSIPSEAAKLVSKVRRCTKLPLFVKLTPNTVNICDVARAVEDAGADALTVMNTLVGMLIDIEKKRPKLGNVMGGMCGPAIKPAALCAVWQIYQITKLPIVGVGGIRFAEDTIEFLMAGASAVAVGSGNLVDPMCTMRIIDGLDAWLGTHGYTSVKEIIGIANSKK